VSENEDGRGHISPVSFFCILELGSATKLVAELAVQGVRMK
jgi:hypothetical protein